jgi:hypothetical protein
MLACITEVESPRWRDGMIEGLTRGYALAANDGLCGRELSAAVIHRFNRLTPPAYHNYVTAYLHQDSIQYGIIPKMLSFWQWRTLAADLGEIARVTELLCCSPGFQEEEVRCALLLDAAVPGDAPYQSLLDHGGPVDPAPHYQDGLVDAYSLCWQFLHDYDLDGVAYREQVMHYLCAFWPGDYKFYRYRCDSLRPSAPVSTGAGSTSCLCMPLEYGTWSTLVGELAAEIDRCTASGAALSRKRVELSRLLLCRVDEPAPSLDWSLPAKIEQELSW